MPNIPEQSMADGNDDASTTSFLNNWTLNDASLLEFNRASQPRYVGLHWGSVPIPAGATINSASIDVKFYSYDDPSFTIYGEKNANSPAFSAVADGPSTRTRTDASQAWEAIDEGILFYTTSPDIGQIIAEIVALPGWELNNSITLLTEHINHATSRCRIWGWENTEGAVSAKLNVAYTESGTETDILYQADIKISEISSDDTAIISGGQNIISNANTIMYFD